MDIERQVWEKGGESVAALPPCEVLHHHHIVVKSTSLLEVAESFYLREIDGQKEKG